MPFENLKILIVHDDKILSRLLYGHLVLLDFTSENILKAENGLVAFDMLTKSSFLPDIIITAKKMPGMDGIELISKIREIDYLKKIPIILATTDPSIELTIPLKKIEVTYYLQMFRGKKILQKD